MSKIKTFIILSIITSILYINFKKRPSVKNQIMSNIKEVTLKYGDTVTIDTFMSMPKLPTKELLEALSECGFGMTQWDDDYGNLVHEIPKNDAAIITSKTLPDNFLGYLEITFTYNHVEVDKVNLLNGESKYPDVIYIYIPVTK